MPWRLTQPSGFRQQWNITGRAQRSGARSGAKRCVHLPSRTPRLAQARSILVFHSKSSFVFFPIPSNQPMKNHQVIPEEPFIEAVAGKVSQWGPGKNKEGHPIDQSSNGSSPVDRRRICHQANRWRSVIKHKNRGKHRQDLMNTLNIHNIATLTRYTVSSGSWNPTVCRMCRQHQRRAPPSE